MNRGDLWHWWRQGFTRDHDGPPFASGSADAATADDRAALWGEALRFLRDRDPDNGWPLTLMAHRALTAAVEETTMFDDAADHSGVCHPHYRHRVIDPEQTAHAAVEFRVDVTESVETAERPIRIEAFRLANLPLVSTD